jgi:chromosome segregation ATPase
MSTPSTGPQPPASTPSARQPQGEKGLIPENVKTILLLFLIVAVGYLLFNDYQIQNQNKADLAKVNESIKALENRQQSGEGRISTIMGDINETQQVIGSTKAELLKKTQAQIQAEGQKTKAEFDKALSTKADTDQVQAQVQAAKSEAEAKIGQVSSEVGGVKTEVSTVKTDLASTRRDLEGTQRQLLDVRDTLNAAVAKNSSELAELRRKGERDYYEFQIAKKNQLTKIEDIRVSLTKTDDKKQKFNLKIVVDDNQLEKKDRTINEPIQFLVGRNRLRYEIVVNWVKKDGVGGYLSIPKDKALSSEHVSSK